MNKSLLTYIIKRLLLMIPTILGILTITFIIVQFVPGGPVEQMLQMLKGDHSSMGGSNTGVAFPGASAGSEVASKGSGIYRGRVGVDEERIEEIRKLYGFDKPAHERFIEMIIKFSKFDLGDSFFYNKGVWDLMKEKLPVSISLGLWSFFLTYLISVPLGISKAVRHGSKFDVATSIIILVGYAIPGFVLGVILLVFFGGGSFLQLFPLRGLTSEDWDQMSLIGKFIDYMWHLFLPLLCLVVGSFAILTMLTKNTILEEIRKQYVLTARSKGLSENIVLWKHVLRNALIPIITGFPAAFVGAFFTGALLIETLFSLDGLGLLSYEAVIKRDYPIVMGTLFFFSLIALFAKLLNDLLYVFVDPRVKFESQKN
ncbi:MAG: microcin ABC transporter permease [Betaproteobacteria bacterium TMED156]|nr:MAG: microcin ABC transporter permease [Betaproteobacteria bacterium TMED156]